MISFIIPTLKEEGVLAHTLKNLRKIKNFDYEIIVSDEGSADRTVEIAKQYADEVLVYRGKARRTIAYGRNVGAKIAKGEYLVFLDADVEIPDPDNFLKIALQNFENEKKLVGLSVFFRVYPELETRSDRFFWWLTNHIHLVNNNILHRGSASGDFLMIKADAFRRVGGFRDDLVASEDNDLYSRLTKVGTTKIESRLHMFHTGRRAHIIGWHRLWWQWTTNYLSWLFFKRAASKEWEVLR